MDFDFTKWLLVLVVITGVLWALEIFVWRKKRDPNDALPVYVDWGASFFPVLALVFVLRAFLFEPFQIPSGSMEPTLEIGDFIVVSKFSYGVRLPIVGTTIIPVGKPKRGDVAVFVPPHDDRYFIKRVVGLPGDRLRVERNQIWINDVAYEQDTIDGSVVSASRDQFGRTILIDTDLKQEVTGEVQHQIYTYDPMSSSADMDEVVVAADHYFMMGDNRDNSQDSRVWGTVHESKLVGRAKIKWMHWESWGSLPSFSRVGSIK